MVVTFVVITFISNPNYTEWFHKAARGSDCVGKRDKTFVGESVTMCFVSRLAQNYQNSLLWGEKSEK
jgi:hypothetical protein